jgi:hypothetical protein
MVKVGTVNVGRGMSGTLIDASPSPGVVLDEVVDTTDVVVATDVEVVVGAVVVVLDVDVVVVGRLGGGGSGGNSMSPKSGKASCEQSTGTPVSPSTKLQ